MWKPAAASSAAVSYAHVLDANIVHSVPEAQSTLQDSQLVKKGSVSATQYGSTNAKFSLVKNEPNGVAQFIVHLQRYVRNSPQWPPPNRLVNSDGKSVVRVYSHLCLWLLSTHVRFPTLASDIIKISRDEITLEKRLVWRMYSLTSFIFCWF